MGRGGLSWPSLFHPGGINIGTVLKKEYLDMIGNKKPGPCRQVPGSNVADRSFKNHLANDPDLYCWFRANHFYTFRLLSYHSFMNRLSLNDPDVLSYTLIKEKGCIKKP